MHSLKIKNAEKNVKGYLRTCYTEVKINDIKSKGSYMGKGSFGSVYTSNVDNTQKTYAFKFV